MRKEEPTQIIFEHLDEKTEFYKWLNEDSNDAGVKRARMLLQQSQSLNENNASRVRLTESELNIIGNMIQKRNEKNKRRRREIISNGVLRGVERRSALPVGRIARGLNHYNLSNVDSNGFELVTTVDGIKVVVIKENQLKQRNNYGD